MCHLSHHEAMPTNLPGKKKLTPNPPLQREYSCGHFIWLASAHCPEYKKAVRSGSRRASKRCPRLEITDFESRPHDICGDCKPKVQAPWMDSFMKKTAPAAVVRVQPLSSPPPAPLAAIPLSPFSSASIGSSSPRYHHHHHHHQSQHRHYRDSF